MHGKTATSEAIAQIKNQEITMKNQVITKDNIVEYIVACGKMLDSLALERQEMYIPIPYWHLQEIERRSRVALSRFKTNDSHFMYRNIRGAWRNY